MYNFSKSSFNIKGNVYFYPLSISIDYEMKKHGCKQSTIPTCDCSVKKQTEKVLMRLAFSVAACFMPTRTFYTLEG